ncbi:hypothetical protein BOQ62_03510 [Chryseobacterium sp. CH21]|uniref:hypothetical protein n=1 Tax=Chryseobacterium sp. CH21 TaxID=713556 RepID=UPI00100B4A1A|nr:hypothetical protein [Chryseobacterium sp. CH21]RXM40918.1 hypothetical protein BOQ62_03510 [Chryseobacterium sp. CH21]
MKTKLKYLLITLLSIMLYSCGGTKPKQTDFIGTWKSSDNGSIKLNKNGTCTLKGVDYYKISSFSKNKNRELNAEGTWQFIENVESGIVDNIDNGIVITYNLPDGTKGEIVFYISGQGISGNNPPWNIFIWEGDPDEMMKYEFIKNK